jgi:ABC-type Fe3+ transport system permease subunit
VTAFDTTPADRRAPSPTTIVLLALVPALAWGTVLVVGSQLHENLCATGATPHRGEWFGIDARAVSITIAIVAALVTVACALVLLGLSRRSDNIESDSGARHFVATLGLVSAVFFLLIIAASIVSTAINPPC